MTTQQRRKLMLVETSWSVVANKKYSLFQACSSIWNLNKLKILLHGIVTEVTELVVLLPPFSGLGTGYVTRVLHLLWHRQSYLLYKTPVHVFTQLTNITNKQKITLYILIFFFGWFSFSSFFWIFLFFVILFFSYFLGFFFQFSTQKATYASVASPMGPSPNCNSTSPLQLTSLYV